jgi:hypothetical protein
MENLSVAGVAERILCLLEKEGGPLPGKGMLEILEWENPRCRIHFFFALRRLLREGKARIHEEGSGRDFALPEDARQTEVLSHAFVSARETPDR